MKDCIFCKIVKGEVDSKIIYEDEDVISFLDRGQISKGHTLIVPKKHYENIFDVPKDVLEKVIITCKKIGLLCKEKLKADGINVVNASGKAAQQSVFHLHFHVVPRFEGDGLDLWFHGKNEDPKNLEEIKEKLLS